MFFKKFKKNKNKLNKKNFKSFDTEKKEKENLSFVEELKDDKQEHIAQKSEELEKKEQLSLSETGEVGELSVDVYEQGDYLFIKSTVAGVKPDDIEVVIDGDILSIRGKRQKEEVVDEENYFYQECYWGSFERTFHLPIRVKEDEVQAQLKNGILTIQLRKAKKPTKLEVRVKGE